MPGRCGFARMRRLYHGAQVGHYAARFGGGGAERMRGFRGDSVDAMKRTPRPRRSRRICRSDASLCADSCRVHARSGRPRLRSPPRKRRACRGPSGSAPALRRVSRAPAPRSDGSLSMRRRRSRARATAVPLIHAAAGADVRFALKYRFAGPVGWSARSTRSTASATGSREPASITPMQSVKPCLMMPITAGGSALYLSLAMKAPYAAVSGCVIFGPIPPSSLAAIHGISASSFFSYAFIASS